MGGKSQQKDPDEELRRRYALWHEISVQEFKGAFDLAVAALKASMIVNGVAAGATLAFVSDNIGSRNILVDRLESMTDAVFWFAAGVLFGLLGTGLGYLRSYFQTAYLVRWLEGKDPDQSRLSRYGTVSQVSAMLLVILSYVAFFGGLRIAATALVVS
tara:strand:+ start:394 stop:867 length:474 start_codon:yes stop_codon:yes gene_type:complete